MSESLKAYRIINLIFAGVIISIFLYSGIFNYTRNNFPVQSFHEKITGQASLSNGLSRSFSAIVRLDFDKALEFNRYGISMFVFFLLQFFLRFFFYKFVTNEFYSVDQVVTIDVILSVSLFLLFFKPFIIDSFRF